MEGEAKELEAVRKKELDRWAATCLPRLFALTFIASSL
jgi:hypothetical protein